jgi:serine/threonine-protein kinase RsbW
MPAMDACGNGSGQAGMDRVRVEFPADTINMSIARTVAAAIAARADLTLDQVEDVRLAMDEATAHMIKIARPGSSVRCDLWIEGRALHASVGCVVDSEPPPEPDPFAWTVLTALVESAALHVDGSTAELRWSLTNDHSLHA